MKQRLISSAVGLAILCIALLFIETIAANVIIALLAMLAVYELLCATGCWKHKLLSASAMIFTAIIPFMSHGMVMQYITVICYLYVLALFAVLLRYHQQLHIEQIAISFFFSLIIPFSFSTLIYQRDRWGATLGVFYVLLSLGCAFLADTGAYFTGYFFGKHKLAPYISPKKTIEGAIGGAIFTPFAMVLLAWLYAQLCQAIGTPIVIHYPALFCISPILSGVSIIGDLSASIIKRQFGVKDYGSIMPGHGGVMDRFDSVLMVAPLVYVISQQISLVQLG